MRVDSNVTQRKQPASEAREQMLRDGTGLVAVLTTRVCCQCIKVDGDVADRLKS